MSVMEPKAEGQQHKLFADISISAQLLADKCKEKEGNVATITVSEWKVLRECRWDISKVNFRQINKSMNFLQFYELLIDNYKGKGGSVVTVIRKGR